MVAGPCKWGNDACYSCLSTIL